MGGSDATVFVHKRHVEGLVDQYAHRATDRQTIRGERNARRGFLHLVLQFRDFLVLPGRFFIVLADLGVFLKKLNLKPWSHRSLQSLSNCNGELLAHYQTSSSRFCMRLFSSSSSAIFLSNLLMDSSRFILLSKCILTFLSSSSFCFLSRCKGNFD